ncbi:hypothetical protein BDU57DRAFT_163561 [Ampelomyces quisqualis]|uniref:Uncharacterized protein n=1 Tax=Ampelomyces quisqualis TaxID=50730 RepID=A0A6A5QNZ5_AMPQU|nr:hypothetical protein BDU57DRAFT_163561 [Ampelomyces quisqualis]
MSSDYGSDILSDDIVPIEDIQPHIEASTATPRQPLKPRDSNVLATPPPSDPSKHNNSLMPSSKTSVITGRQSHLQKYRSQSSASASAIPSTPLRQHAPPQQKPPSSSQRLLTPSSIFVAPSHGCAPPSSQPTPSRRPIEPRLSKIPTSTQSRQVNRLTTTSTPPTMYQRNTEPPLYRFPFGTHRGKTLFEVPENYIAYLRVDQEMADSMPGLTAVLRLFDAGQRPSIPPSSSQPIAQEAPSSSASAKVSASQPVTLQERSSPSVPSSTSQAPYRFDFGKHIGLTLSEVPADYIRFLKQKGIVESKPALAVAVIKHEREQAICTQQRTSEPATSQYTLTFGKHTGKTLNEVPDSYIDWLKTSSSMYQESKTLRDAIANWDYLHPVLPPKPSSKRKRAPPNRISHFGLSTSSNGRRYAPKKKMKKW